MFDFHVHDHISFDAPAATLDALCRQALQSGMQGFALTNHYEIGAMACGVYPVPDLCAEDAEFAAAQERYGDRLVLLRGIEIGQPHWDKDVSARLLQKRPYDVVLGSVHLLEGFRDFYDMDFEATTDEQLRADWLAYIEELTTMSRTADYDVQTHIVYPLRYIPPERRERVTGLPRAAREQYEPILRNLVQRGIALELNTSCVRKAGMAHADPDEDLLRFYRELGGTCISVGSDAHRVCDLAADVRDALRMAERVGFRYLTAFCRRKKVFLPIADGRVDARPLMEIRNHTEK